MQRITIREDTGRRRVQTVNEEPSRTVQSDRQRADIGHILEKYEQTGVLVNMREVDLEYRDVGEFSDFADMMHQVKAAEAAFLELPSKVRQVFDHDVARWLDAAHDGLDEFQTAKLTELGVLEQVKADPPPEPREDPPEDPAE